MLLVLFYLFSFIYFGILRISFNEFRILKNNFEHIMWM